MSACVAKWRHNACMLVFRCTWSGKRTRAYGIVTLLPRSLRASIGVVPPAGPITGPPVDAGAIEPPIATGLEPGVNDPPLNGSELGLTEAAIDVVRCAGLLQTPCVCGVWCVYGVRRTAYTFPVFDRSTCKL